MRTPTVLTTVGAVLLVTACGGPQLGDSCRQVADCGDGFCNLDLPGGACSKVCGTDAACGPSGACVTRAGFSLGQCFAACPAPGTQSTCRAGYACVAKPGSSDGYCDADRGTSAAGGGGGGSSGGGAGGGGGSAGPGGACTGFAYPCGGTSEQSCTFNLGCSWSGVTGSCVTDVGTCAGFAYEEQCLARHGCRWTR